MTDPVYPFADRLAVAFELAERGWHVFPVWGDAAAEGTALVDKKAPIGKWKDIATTDTDAVIELWTQNPLAWVGCIPGRADMVVIDLDGPDGVASYEQITGCALDPTAPNVVPTMKPGHYHLFFQRPDGLPTIPNSKPATCIDVRCDNGYAIVYGTPAEVLPMPAELVEILTPRKQAAKRLPFKRKAADEDYLQLDLIPEGDRHGLIQKILGSLAGAESMTWAMYRLARALCSGTKPFTEIESQWKWSCEQEGKDPDDPFGIGGDSDSDSAEFTRDRVDGGDMDGVLLARSSGGKDIWFPRGSVSLVAGASGAGKSSFMLPLLRAQAENASYLGHVGAGLRPFMIIADRGERSNRRTLRRLGMLDDPIPAEVMPIARLDTEAIAAIKSAIERQTPLPQVVFVEGADLLVSEPNKSKDVAAFLGGLQQIATHYHIAIVLSVGSAKMNPKTRPDQARDRVFGSVMWGRMTDTIVILTSPGDGTSDDRDVIVLHRDASPEKYAMMFSGEGRLVLRQTEPPKSASEKEREFDGWLLQQTTVRRGDAKKQFPSMNGTMRKKLFDERIGTVLTASPDNDGVYIVQRSAA